MLPDWFYSAKITIPAPAEIVWRIVANPNSWPQINSLCKTVTRSSSSSVVSEGERFELESRLHEGPGLKLTDWEVSSIESPISIRYYAVDRENPKDALEMKFNLSPRGNGRQGTVLTGILKPASIWPSVLLMIFLRTEGMIFKDTFLRGIRRVAKDRARGIE